jgi:CRISPR-associated endoribonuclease Cas6
MISSLFFCCAAESGHVPISSGYLLFSALSRHLDSSPLQEILHAKDDGRLFTLSSLMPDYFWKTFRCTPHRGNIVFEKGALFAFRVSLPDLDAFESFSSRVLGALLTLDGASFKVLGASQSGENDMSRQMDPEELNLIPPFSGVSVDFLLPTGFKSNGRQNIFPAPELFFGSLAIRRQKVMGEAFDAEKFFDRNKIFGRVSVTGYSLSSRAVRLKNDQVFRGCVGDVRYSFEDLPETDRALLSQLAALAPFCGVGYKVAQGMGLVNTHF